MSSVMVTTCFFAITMIVPVLINNVNEPHPEVTLGGENRRASPIYPGKWLTVSAPATSDSRGRRQRDQRLVCGPVSARGHRRPRRRRARAEDRIRCAKDTGLTNLPLHDFAQNQIWCAIVALACELTAWMQMLALAGTDARRWEPKQLRIRLFTVPATLARTGRQRLLHLVTHAAMYPGSAAVSVFWAANSRVHLRKRSLAWWPGVSLGGEKSLVRRLSAWR